MPPVRAAAVRERGLRRRDGLRGVSRGAEAGEEVRLVPSRLRVGFAFFSRVEERESFFLPFFIFHFQEQNKKREREMQKGFLHPF